MGHISRCCCYLNSKNAVKKVVYDKMIVYKTTKEGTAPKMQVVTWLQIGLLLKYKLCQSTPLNNVVHLLYRNLLHCGWLRYHLNAGIGNWCKYDPNKTECISIVRSHFTNSVKEKKQERRPLCCPLLAHNVVGCHYVHLYPLLQALMFQH